jgi:hypothetical protein
MPSALRSRRSQNAQIDANRDLSASLALDDEQGRERRLAVTDED